MLITTLALAALAGPDDDVATLTWRGDELILPAVAVTLQKEGFEEAYAEKVEAQLRPLSTWILAHDIDVRMTDDARVVLMTMDAKLGKKRMKLAQETIDTFDRLYTPPDRSSSKETYKQSSWGASEYKPDTRAVLIAEVRGEDVYEELVTAAGGADDTPAQNWVSTMIDRPGFCDGRMGISGYQESPNGFEVGDVWRVENELTNRLARLLLYRHFGPQPVWFDVATGWVAEEAVHGDMYSFPYRFEFVGIGEHDGWKNDLRKMFKPREDLPLRPAEFCEWKKNTWSDDAAAIAWGLTTYLQRVDPDCLGKMAEEHRLRYKGETIIEKGEHNWEYNPISQISPENQIEVMQSIAGEDVLNDVSTFFREWKDDKKSKKKKKRRR